ncbi:MAG: chemotaxis protein CheW [Deltaproteobacteria bacterium]|nr:chemotaxis protein CheW [Deltaproteobacteria bacterium]
MTDGDKLLIYIDDKIFAVDADTVDALVETERFFMLPMLQSHSFSAPYPLHGGGQGAVGFIKGVITRRGDVVVVVDIGDLFGAPSVQGEGRYKVLVLKKDALCLGIYVGAKGLSFLWEEDLKNLEFKPLTENYIHGMIDPSGKKIRILDWQRILEETQRLVSSR